MILNNKNDTKNIFKTLSLGEHCKRISLESGS